MKNSDHENDKTKWRKIIFLDRNQFVNQLYNNFQMSYPGLYTNCLFLLLLCTRPSHSHHIRIILCKRQINPEYEHKRERTFILWMKKDVPFCSRVHRVKFSSIKSPTFLQPMLLLAWMFWLKRNCRLRVYYYFDVRVMTSVDNGWDFRSCFIQFFSRTFVF